MYHYKIAGLDIAAEMELPGAIPQTDGCAEVIIRDRAVPTRLEQPTLRGPIWELDSRHFLLRLPGTRFLAIEGRTLDLQLEPGTTSREALPFVLGTGIGALLYQRGVMVLHAATVAFNGRAYAFCGRSGAGKSTLAAALCRAGCDFVSDDISAIGIGEDGVPIVWPDGRQLKLFEKSIDAVDLNERRLYAVRTGIDKFYVDPPRSSGPQAMPLAGVYVLEEDRWTDAPQIAALTSLDGAQALMNETYRPRLALAMARSGQTVATTAAILRSATVFSLKRPCNLDGLTTMVAMLKAHWNDAIRGTTDAVPA